KSIPVQVIEDRVVDLELSGEPIGIIFGRSAPCKVDRCVIDTGNHLPRDPLVRTKAALRSARYFRDPWKLASVKDVRPDLPVLIIGNGLTMVDTVLGMIEQGHTGELHSISPHGFNILPHRHNGMHYSALVEELNEGMHLIGLV